MLSPKCLSQFYKMRGGMRIFLVIKSYLVHGDCIFIIDSIIVKLVYYLYLYTKK